MPFGKILKKIRFLSNNNNQSKVSKQSAGASKPNHARLMKKTGVCKFKHINVPSQRQRIFKDIYTTLIDTKWRYVIMFFLFNYFISWIFFAALYYLSALIHGDFKSDADKKCVQGLESFTSAFLFSIECQQTIGFGTRAVTEKCPAVIMILCLQILVGVTIQVFTAGLVFAKLIRPKKRAATLIFSNNAIICKRDSKLCLLFRIGDIQRTNIVEAHIRMQMIKKRTTEEGEALTWHQFDMDVGFKSGLDRIFVVWPVTVCHVIDEFSPLYEYGTSELENTDFEIIIIFEGTVESTAMTMQCRTSYLPNEILWGHRFEPLMTCQRHNGQYFIDYSRFNNTQKFDLPPKSQKEIDELETVAIKRALSLRKTSMQQQPLTSPFPWPSKFGSSLKRFSHHSQSLDQQDAAAGDSAACNRRSCIVESVINEEDDDDVVEGSAAVAAEEDKQNNYFSKSFDIQSVASADEVEEAIKKVLTKQMSFQAERKISILRETDIG